METTGAAVTVTTADIWLAPFHQLAADLGGWAPKLLAAFVVLTAGLVLAWLARGLAAALFRVLGVDERFKGLWLFRFWTRSMRGRTPTATAADFLFYATLFLAALLAIRMLGVEAGQAILTTLLGVVPRVLSFMLILFLGALLAVFLSVFAQLVLAGSGIQHPGFWGKAIAWGTFGLTVVFSLEPLGPAGRLVTSVLLLGLSAVGLAAAVAFGLGCKDLAREFVLEMLKEEAEDK
jgi:hypothetical protein